MTHEHAAALAGIEELANKKKAIMTEIDLEQQKKTDVQTQLRELTEKLSRINDSLGRKVSARNEYDTRIPYVTAGTPLSSRYTDTMKLRIPMNKNPPLAAGIAKLRHHQL